MWKIRQHYKQKLFIFYDFYYKKFFEENQQKEILKNLKKKIKEQKISNNENLKNESIQNDIHRSESLKILNKNSIILQQWF